MTFKCIHNASVKILKILAQRKCLSYKSLDIISLLYINNNTKCDVLSSVFMLTG